MEHSISDIYGIINPHVITREEVTEAFTELGGGDYYLKLIGEELYVKFQGKKSVKELHQAWGKLAKELKEGRYSEKNIYAVKMMMDITTFKACWKRLPKYYLDMLAKLFPN